MEDRLFILVAAGLIAAFLYIITFFLCTLEHFRKYVEKHFWLQPNYLSVWRTLFFLVGIVFYFSFDGIIWYCVAIHLIAIGAIGDAIDGLVARECFHETEIGKWLDPFLDKVCYLTPLTVFAYQGYISVPLHWLIVIVEMVFGQLIVRKILQRRKHDISSIPIGKIKTVMFFILIFFCDLARFGDMDPGTVYWTQIICLVLAVLSAGFKLRPLIMK